MRLLALHASPRWRHFLMLHPVSYSVHYLSLSLFSLSFTPEKKITSQGGTICHICKRRMMRIWCCITFIWIIHMSPASRDMQLADISQRSILAMPEIKAVFRNCQVIGRLLDSFEKSWIGTIHFVMSVCLSVRLWVPKKQLWSYWMNFHEIRNFENMSRNFLFSLKIRQEKRILYMKTNVCSW
jgi:hypothetical protein